jgi:glutamate 2,3-aminomutase
MANEKSLIRTAELDLVADKNKLEKEKVRLGTDLEVINKTELNKNRILDFFNAKEENWNSYNWQIKHRVDDVDVLNSIFPLSKEKYEEIRLISKLYRWSISPYYLSLVDFSNDFDPIGLMCLPTGYEQIAEGESDPMAEEFTNPAGSVTRRYPDRLIINVTNMCGMYCRFCQRKRNIGEIDHHEANAMIDESIDYIAKTDTIRDILITGGDPLTLPNALLERIVSKLRAIEHVEMIRIGTRIPVTLPQRVDQELVDMLKKYHPIYVNTHFNHPREITKESVKACALLADGGMPLGNQAVLLNGINNDKYTMLRLNQGLLKARVRPYYIFHAKKVKGTTHFNCDINDGLDIIEFLRGNTSGMAIPAYIVNAPGGLGKVPLLRPNYKFLDDYNVEITTWEGKKIIYPNHKTEQLTKKR